MCDFQSCPYAPCFPSGGSARDDSFGFKQLRISWAFLVLQRCASPIVLVYVLNVSSLTHTHSQRKHQHCTGMLLPINFLCNVGLKRVSSANGIFLCHENLNQFPFCCISLITPHSNACNKLTFHFIVSITTIREHGKGNTRIELLMELEVAHDRHYSTSRFSSFFFMNVESIYVTQKGEEL